MAKKVSLESVADILGFANKPISELNEFWQNLKKDKSPDELKSESWKAVEEAYYKHLIWRFNYPRKVFGRQRIAYWLILVVVFGVVGAGIVFSYAQLTWAMKVGEIQTLKTDLAATATSLSLGSSVVGLFVLFISLAFFYFFLKHVFEIKNPAPPLVEMEKELKEKMKKTEELVSKGKDELTPEEFEQLKTNIESVQEGFKHMLEMAQFGSGSVSTLSPTASGIVNYGTSSFPYR